MEYQIQGLFDLQDFRAANRLHLKKTLLGIWLSWPGLTLLSLLVCMNLISVFLGLLAWIDALPVLVFLVIWLWMIYGWLPRRRDRIFRKHREFQELFTMKMTVDSLGIYNARGSAEIVWKQFLKWREDQHLFLLYRSEMRFYMIPKRFLEQEPESCEFLRKQLLACGVPLG